MSEPRWIKFLPMPRLTANTDRWEVVSKDGGEGLGTVEWYCPWRKYIFAPNADYNLVFEETCLRDIAAFVEARTREHREELRARKAVTA
jgi:hypothetical protein